MFPEIPLSSHTISNGDQEIKKDVVNFNTQYVIQFLWMN